MASVPPAAPEIAWASDAREKTSAANASIKRKPLLSDAPSHSSTPKFTITLSRPAEAACPVRCVHLPHTVNRSANDGTQRSGVPPRATSTTSSLAAARRGGAGAGPARMYRVDHVYYS